MIKFHRLMSGEPVKSLSVQGKFPVFAAEFLNRMGGYSVLKFHGGTATKCRVFTNEDIGFVPLRKLVSCGITLDGMVDFFDDIGCREQFQRMLVLDAITFNVDRHLGNMGVLVDNDIQEILGIAPNFDFNLSMLPYVLWEEFGDIGRKLLDYGPAAGDDFTRLGQQMLTSEIRRELINH